MAAIPLVEGVGGNADRLTGREQLAAQHLRGPNLSGRRDGEVNDFAGFTSVTPWMTGRNEVRAFRQVLLLLRSTRAGRGPRVPLALLSSHPARYCWRWYGRPVRYRESVEAVLAGAAAIAKEVGDPNSNQVHTGRNMAGLGIPTESCDASRQPTTRIHGRSGGQGLTSRARASRNRSPITTSRLLARRSCMARRSCGRLRRASRARVQQQYAADEWLCSASRARSHQPASGSSCAVADGGRGYRLHPG